MKFLVKKKRSIGDYRFLGKNGHQSLTPASTLQRRLMTLVLLFAIFGVFLVVRLAKLQIWEGRYYYTLASDQHEFFKQLYPQRGTIYWLDRGVDGAMKPYPVAVNSELSLIYAIPKAIKDPEAVAAALQESIDFTDDITDLVQPVEWVPPPELTAEQVTAEQDRLKLKAEADAKDLFNANLVAKLSKPNDPYEPIKHRVSDESLAKLQSYNLQGIAWAKEPSRYYPEGSSGSQILGFVGHTQENNILKGYYGVEGNFNALLSGEAGFRRSELDSAGRWIAVADEELRTAKDGSDVVLTINRAIEYYACQQLFFGVKNSGADSGSLIVMDPKTGAVWAMCNFPDFDPNKYNRVDDVRVYSNSSINQAYEPGSIFKGFTIAAALDKGAITPFTGYEDKGEIKIDEFTIRNAMKKAYGWKTMTEVLEESLNLGTIFAARQIGMATFREYVKAFGFGEVTDIELSPEAVGDISNLNRKSDIYMATASFGQGITTTPIQLVRAMGAIANEGNLMQPYIVDRVIKPDGTEEKTQSKIIRQVISPKSAKLVGSMLVSVVSNGHAQAAQIPGYLVAGKTGTAQVPDKVHGGYSDQTIHSFLGYAPFDDPKFVMLVKLDNVKNAQYAEGSASPVFSKVGKFILDYLNVPPSVK